MWLYFTDYYLRDKIFIVHFLNYILEFMDELREEKTQENTAFICN